MPSLATDAAAALLTSLGNEARGLFAVGDNPLVDPAGFLADPDAPPLSQQPAKALGRFICRRWARFPGDSNNPAADRLYARACGPYLDSIGEGVDPGEIGPPFEGGQCPVAYTVFATSQGTDLSIGGATPLSILGPLGTPAQTSVLVGSPFPDSTRYEFRFPSDPTKVLNFTARAEFNPDPGFRVAGRVDGQPDDCGNPPPEYTRPRPPIVLPPIVPIFIDLPDIGPVNVDVELFPDGTIEIGSPTLNVDVTIAPPNVDGGEEGEDTPGPGSPRPPQDTGLGGDAEGSVPPGEELVGVLVEVLESPIGANTYDGVSETIFRGVGYVRMGYPGRLALDMGGAALRSPQFFLAPVRGLTAWQVKANNGFRLRTTPYFREV